jgi:hypothetical protein
MADVYCVIDVRLPNSGFEISLEAATALVARRLSLQFDLYALPDSEDESNA